jgi:hypothetical protein
MITFEGQKMCPGMGKMMKIVVLGYKFNVFSLHCVLNNGYTL